MDPKRALASLGVALALLGCDDKKDSASQSASVEASYQQLSGAFATCDQALEQCVPLAQGDHAALSACDMGYRSCRDEAGEQSQKPLAQAIQACGRTVRECEQNAEGDPEREIGCRHELWSCLGDHRPGNADDTDESDGDAGSEEPGHHGSSVRECIEKLKESVEAGEDAHICARNMRLCISDALPEPNRSGSARACIGEFRDCVRKKRGPRECVDALRQCTHPSAPVEQ